MKKIIPILLALIFVASCAAPIRYTVEEIKEYPADTQKKIKAGEITLGMTYVQVRYAWGPPYLVNVLPPEKDGRDRVEWIYKKFGVFRTTLSFTGKKLVEIRSNEPGFLK